MDFQFTPEQESFRQEIREFCKQEAIESLLEELEDRGELAYTHSPEFYEMLAKKGWLGCHWPREYGGQGRTHMEMAVFNEEMGYFRLPVRPFHVTVYVAGTTIIAFGNEKQKKEYLPRIASGEVLFCQGFTEPDAGSDLASLDIRAVAGGGNYVVNGQKIFTSHAHVADYCLLMARTDPSVPQHKGISLLIVDMKSPGITVRPLWTLAGGRVNAVYFDDVRVPAENLLGEENKGWYHSAITLTSERSGTLVIGMCQRLFEEMVEYTKETLANGEPLIKNPLVRQKVADLAIKIEVGRLLCYRVAWMQSNHLIPEYEASGSKVYGADVMQRVGTVGMEILGPYGQLKLGSKWAPLRGRVENFYRQAAGFSLAGGSSEIQKNIIATRGLGLPRG